MASDRKIVPPTGVVVGSTIFKPGDEDKLAKAAPQWNLNQLADKGILSGDWSNAAAEAGLPTLADLPAHISNMNADEVRALQDSDDRKGATSIYEARLAELAG